MYFVSQMTNYTEKRIKSIQNFLDIILRVKLTLNLVSQLVICRMSRNRSEKKPVDRHQLDVFGRRGGDPFAQMHQVMRSFGGGMFGNDFFSDGFMKDPFEQMMDFSNGHRGLHNSGKQGSYVCQTFVSSSKMGPDGKMKNESYFQNSAGQHKNGQTISQKQQAYKNNDGIKRIAEERMLNDKGRKIIRQKRGNNEPEQTTNHYYNLEAEEADRFDTNWRGVNNQLKFLENHQKYIQSLPYQQQPRQLGLGYEPRREEYRNNRQPEYRQPIQQGHRLEQDLRQPEQRSQYSGDSRVNGIRGLPQSRGNYSQKGSSYKSGSRGQY